MNGNLILMSAADAPVLLPFYSWGIGIIRAIQSIKNPGLTALMKLISNAGTEYVYIVLGLFIFWCVNQKKGFSLGVLVIVSGWLNSLLKIFFNQPRPFNFDPSLGITFEPSPGFPSGHAQSSMTFWIAAVILFFYASSANKKYRRPSLAIACILILLIGFSRLYLGVHFLTDVLGGWIIALVILALYFIFEKQAVALFTKGGKRLQLITAAVIALIMNALLPSDTSLSGLLLGFCAGYSLMIRHFPYTAADVPAGKGNKPAILLGRFILGAIGAAIIYLGLKYIFPGKGSFFEGVR
ncbi:MAG: phosphatase PAP2 family protein, partial [Treponema sp.]|nr:phosphatase PAP2 family protein [Treponema sp.]